MKLNLILQRSNLFEVFSKELDYDSEFFSYRETIFSYEINYKTEDDLERTIEVILGLMKYSFPRNSVERINDKSQKYINILILDYPIERKWSKDTDIQHLINFIKQLSEVKETSNETEVFEMNEIERIMEIELHGDYNSEIFEELKVLFKNFEIEYKIIYQKEYQINAGASGGGIKLILEWIGNAANMIAVVDFLKEKFSEEPEAIQEYHMNKVKKKLSEYYKIHESQLNFESIDYDNENRQTIYTFTTRKHYYFMTYSQGKLLSIFREKKNE